MPDEMPAKEALRRLLEQVLPGRSDAVERLRREILTFCGSLTAKSVLLRGPIGSGKSTIARLIGFLKRIAPLNTEAAARRASDIRFDGPNRVDSRLMPWYVELALTGLTETLAETQLFGSIHGAYTGATDRAGIFEMAQRERGTGRAGAGAQVTGGIVFLDEVGELTTGLQAKLLPVLSGGLFYRVGAEGNEQHATQFAGVTIAASWRRLDTGLLRPDLLSRLSSYVIDVPGMDQRPEDFDALLDEAQRMVIGSFVGAVDELCRVEPEAARAYWRERRENVHNLGRSARRMLLEVDWSRHGNLRGIAGALEQIIVAGHDVEEVLSRLPTVDAGAENRPSTAGLIGRLLERRGDGMGLAAHVRALEVEARQALSYSVLGDAVLRRELARNLGIAEDRLTYQVQQLPRSRRRTEKEQ